MRRGWRQREVRGDGYGELSKRVIANRLDWQLRPIVWLILARGSDVRWGGRWVGDDATRRDEGSRGGPSPDSVPHDGAEPGLVLCMMGPGAGGVRAGELSQDERWNKNE